MCSQDSLFEVSDKIQNWNLYSSMHYKLKALQFLNMSPPKCVSSLYEIKRDDFKR